MSGALAPLTRRLPVVQDAAHLSNPLQSPSENFVFFVAEILATENTEDTEGGGKLIGLALRRFSGGGWPRQQTVTPDFSFYILHMFALCCAIMKLYGEVGVMNFGQPK